MRDRILRIGKSDLEVSDERMKSLMNDMTNAKTPGYQKSEIVTRAFPLELQSAMDRINSRSSTGPMEPKIEGTFYNRIKGSLVNTGSKLDTALGGDGYFCLYGPGGEIYTRDGRFTLDPNGNLLSVAGEYPILGEGGPINLSSAEDVTINQNGEIMINDEKVAKLRIVKIENPDALEPLTGSFYQGDSEVLMVEEDLNPRVVQGYVETSNVSVVDQMMELMYLSQKYQITTKVVQARDSGLAAAMQLGSTQ
ncbi:MAG: flagellar hook-basal body complex protein [Candidatus Margulisbacteria bacterium]|nr:flagellar hook-basal body complex protein [Candidatus Margulisiibacteriota bacterium]MBU1021480.1 flagellar hook-basal body complex protein [Candidatus Margulisiibacteriota bacterium]MBU1728565.1 flagellar hook-basal body complex protein [Candidatus Margulisiibacteriota bacterium]MBU1955856.1 flagellar hook-basal body complex protein [Candidatus Margulisiibacteriota bacterium]